MPARISWSNCGQAGSGTSPSCPASLPAHALAPVQPPTVRINIGADGGRPHSPKDPVQGLYSTTSRLPAHDLSSAAGHLVLGDVLDMGGDAPLMTPRVLEHAGPVAVELVSHR